MSFLCVAGETFTFSVKVFDQVDDWFAKTNPTIDVGDFQCSVNGGAFSNLDNLPVVSPASSEIIHVTLSAAETTSAAANGRIEVRGIDASGDQWYPVYAEARVAAADIDDMAEAVWAYAPRTFTQSATSVVSAVEGETLGIRRGESETIPLTGLPSIADRTKLWFTVKDDRSYADSASILQIEEDAGLLYLNGAVADTAADGDITVQDETAANITIVIEKGATALLSPATSLFYDVHMLDSNSKITTIASGIIVIIADVGRVTA